MQKYDASGDVLAAMKALKEAGATPKWGKLVEDGLIRRNVFLGDLKQVSSWLSCTYECLITTYQVVSQTQHVGHRLASRTLRAWPFHQCAMTLHFCTHWSA